METLGFPMMPLMFEGLVRVPSAAERQLNWMKLFNGGCVAQEAKQDRTGKGPDFPVVCIGASAGGVEALLRLFETAPLSSGVAFVVVLHLSPDHTSHADSVIQSVTRLPVRQITASTLLEKDAIYVIPPGRSLSMVDGYLRLSEPESPRSPPTSIDVFFRSLADAHGSRSFAVVLSGAGSDGSVGIARVRERGGVTIAQRPDEAQYGEMPRNAIATGDVDLVLSVSDIIPRLLELARNAARIELPAPSDPEQSGGTENGLPETSAIDDVLQTLRARTRHDFSNYKRGTVVRRIERRMQVNGLPTVVSYRDFLGTHVEETPKLLADMLIGVTNFFRDPDAFNTLESIVHAELAKTLKGREELRAWVPACATGEEAYSIAMILDEASRRLPQRPRVVVYASDIDERAVSIARSASYPAAIENDISPGRLSQYFNKEGNRYRLVKSLRDTVIFAAHNLLRDPPFSRIDIVSCRNFLIYLDRRAQTRVLESIHFSLRPHEGLLFLGTAESADFASDLFTPIQKQQKIYRALPNATVNSLLPLGPVPTPLLGAQTFFAMPAGVKPGDALLPSQIRGLDLFGPPTIIMRSDGTIMHRSANANRLTEDIRQHRVANLFDIVRSDAQGAVRRAVQRCMTQARREDENAVPFITASGETSVDLSLRPYRDAARGEYLMCVTCDLLTPLPDSAPPLVASADNETVDSLKQALAGSEERLFDSLAHEQSSSEALRASNEELQAMNEELRSATEELEASREELQSLNEELVTVNSELLAKVQESARVSDDLQNLISLVGVATVFVDRSFKIKRYTSPADTLFNILPSDIGRPLQDLTHKLDYPRMVDDLRVAFESLKMSETDVRSKDGRTFLARVLPYRTDDDRIDGAVLALIDISEQRAAQHEARASEEKLKLAARDTHDFAIVVLDRDGTIVSWNVGATRIFGFSPEEMLGQPLAAIFTSEDIANGIPELEREKASKYGRAEDDRWHATKSGKPVFCSGLLSRIESPGFSGFTKIVHDATRRKLADSKKQEVLERERAQNSEIVKLSRLKDEFIAVLSHELKNPLNLIHMKAEMLARMPEARNISRVQEVSDAIQKSVLAQAQLIDDLLDFSRIQTGKLSLRFSPTDVADTARTIASAMKEDFDAAGVQLQVDIPEAVALIRGDTVRIEQIVWNLLSNALKFTPHGGQVNLHVRQQEGKVRLEVADTGCGIPRDSLESVFEMFHQVPSTTHRTRTSGLGIGLSLVRQLAQLHGGAVEALSDGENQGARFVVWLPADASARRQAGDSVADLSVLRNVDVLLVEDAEESLNAMKELLSLYDARVTTATDATEALKLAERNPPAIVVTDINLPDMDGFELVCHLRQLPHCSDIPIVALTGRPIVQDEARARGAGCSAWLSKPFDLQAFAEIVRRFRSGE
ncbi:MULTISPECIES: chemotaxis protein CheB [Caballeronia]|uniref:histidine kinase n=1 Tax=Caballeronia zhejiangensis TaxID=871203 RepID=A0A656Q8Z7_9BURK|nr:MULTISPECIES: chemotaxis protein CheB [Caballeronia]KDR25501.1 chemotaxis protein [Caballeronia zhejiangensis]